MLGCSFEQLFWTAIFVRLFVLASAHLPWLSWHLKPVGFFCETRQCSSKPEVFWPPPVNPTSSTLWILKTRTSSPMFWSQPSQAECPLEQADIEIISSHSNRDVFCSSYNDIVISWRDVNTKRFTVILCWSRKNFLLQVQNNNLKAGQQHTKNLNPTVSFPIGNVGLNLAFNFGKEQRGLKSRNVFFCKSVSHSGMFWRKCSHHFCAFSFISSFHPSFLWRWTEVPESFSHFRNKVHLQTEKNPAKHILTFSDEFAFRAGLHQLSRNPVQVVLFQRELTFAAIQILLCVGAR